MVRSESQTTLVFSCSAELILLVSLFRGLFCRSVKQKGEPSVLALILDSGYGSGGNRSYGPKLIMRAFLISTSLISALGGCATDLESSPPAQELPMPKDTRTAATVSTSSDNERHLLHLNLYSGDASNQKTAKPSLVETEPLTATEVLNLQRRVKKPLPSSTPRFQLPPKGKAPPRSFSNVSRPFPAHQPKSSPPEAPTIPTPVTVIRSSPEGEVGIARDVQIQFSQPMRPLGAPNTETNRPPHVVLTPQPSGAWRWVDPATLVFEPTDGQLPSATTYTLKVRKGLKSSHGNVLDADYETRFLTPAPEVIRVYPHKGQNAVKTRPVILLSFNHQVDATQVVRKAQLRVEDQEGPPLTLATETDIAKDPYVSRALESAGLHRAVALIPKTDLRADAEIRLELAVGPWSKEGPRPASAPFRTKFRTRGPLEIDSLECGWGKECRPGTPLRIRLSNRLAEHKKQPEPLATVKPSIDGLEVKLYSSEIVLQGLTKALTTYTIQLNPKIQDEHGQNLGSTKALTVKVEGARPFLSGPNAGRVVRLLPGTNSIPIYSTGTKHLNIKTRKVEAQDWARWLAKLRNSDEKLNDIGRAGFERQIPAREAPQFVSETLVDLGETLSAEKHGMALVEVSALIKGKRRDIRFWTVTSNVLLDAWTSHKDLYVVATKLDGSPIHDLEVRMGPSGPKGRTNTHGLVKLTLPTKPISKHPWIESDNGGFLPEGYWSRGFGFARKKPEAPQLSILTLDDRGLYRPGETAHIKGWVRRFEVESGLGQLSSPADVRYTIFGPQRNEWSKGRVKLGAHGSFDIEVNIPKDAHLGTAYIALEFSAQGIKGQSSHALRIEEFRRPKIEVQVKLNAPPHIVGQDLRAEATAKTYTGSPVGLTNVNWLLSESPATYSPPGWVKWSFGQNTPWWDSADIYAFGGHNPSLHEPLRMQGQTNSFGKAQLVIEPKGIRSPYPVHLNVLARVEDVDRRDVAASAHALIHPSNLYIGLRTKKMFMGRDEALVVETVAVDLNGKITLNAKMVVSLHPVPGFGISSKNVESEAIATCHQVAQNTPVECTFEAPSPGRYLVQAEVIDDQGRTNRSQTTVYWSGRTPSTTHHPEHETIELIPNKDTYAPGEVARVKLRSSLAEAQGFWMTIGDGVLDFKPLKITDGHAEFEFSITRRMIPGVALEVWLVGGTDKKPREAQRRLSLPVFPKEDVLKVELRPLENAWTPGSEAQIDVVVKNAQGQPVSDAEVTLAVVDEAVLAVSHSKWPEPLSKLLIRRNQSVRTWHSRSELLLSKDTRLTELIELEGGGIAYESDRLTALSKSSLRSERKVSNRSKAIEVRTNFKPIAHFSPGLLTDQKGHTRVQFTLPDDLTRYRVRAIAATRGASFGQGESSFVARKSLSIEPALPRFLTYGDKVELPFIIQNQTPKTLRLLAAVETVGLKVLNSGGVSTTIGPHQRIELRFPAKAETIGEAVVRAVITSGTETDAAEKRLPVYAPTTQEAFAEYGSLEGGGTLARQLTVPPEAAPSVGGVAIEIAPTRLLAAKDAFDNTVGYRYACAEQRASKLIAWTAFRSFQNIFEAGGSTSKPAYAWFKDVEELLKQQRRDGGWNYWPRAERSDGFLTAHVLHALLRVLDTQASSQELESIEPDIERAMKRATRWLKKLPETLDAQTPPSIASAIRAHSLWVLTKEKPSEEHTYIRQQIDAVLELAGGPTQAPSEVLAWLHGAITNISETGALKTQLETALSNRTTLTAQTAHLTSTYSEGGHLILTSAHRADAIFLLSLLTSGPRHPLVEKLLTGLLSGRRASGDWLHTQANAWALLAIARYAEVKEQTPPRFTTSAWIGEQLAFSETFKARGAAKATTVPMMWLKEHATARDLVVDQQGSGRMYYRLGLSFAPQSLQVEAESQGFTIQRRYEAIDEDEDVQATQTGWRVRPGARVRVHLELVARGPRHHVAFIDRLPAGFEPLHPDLSPLETLERNRDRQPYRWSSWDHEQLRDTGSEVFAVHLTPGLHRYTYVAQATTPGQYLAPPAYAEQMYAPETFGRSASESVEIRAQ